MPDEAKLNENEDGNAFGGPYVPSPPPDHSHVLNQMLVELQRITKRGPPIGLACCDSVSMACLQHAFVPATPLNN